MFRLGVLVSTAIALTVTALSVPAPALAAPISDPQLGNVWSWGGNVSYGADADAPTVPTLKTGVTSATQLATAPDGRLALLADGTVRAWGVTGLDNGGGFVQYSNTPVFVNGLRNVVQVEASPGTRYALTATGDVFAWGTTGTAAGQTTYSLHPTLVSPPADSSGIAMIAGSYYLDLLVVCKDGTVWRYGQQGTGANVARATVPTQVDGLSDVTSVSAGLTAYALHSDGTVSAWSLGEATNSGNPYVLSTVPSTVAGLPPLRSVTASRSKLSTFYGVDRNGGVWAWGSNSSGVLGDGTQTEQAGPVRVAGPTDVVQVVAGGLSAYALTAAGTVWAWGSQLDGGLGTGLNTAGARSAAVQVPSLAKFSSLSAGGTSVTALQTTAVAPGGFQALPSFRLLDTRNGTGQSATRAVPAQGTITLQVTGRGGVPATGAGSVALTVTATAALGAGYVTVYPSDVARPITSNVNFLAQQSIANLVVTPLSASGTVSLYNASPGTVQLIADVAGYYSSGSATSTGSFNPVTPVRILDTRTGTGVPIAPAPIGVQDGTVGPNGQVTILASAPGDGVPSSSVAAVILNVTAAAPTSAGFVTVFGAGSTRPISSNVNFATGQTIANLVVAPVSSDGHVTLYHGGPGRVRLVADVFGYVLAGTPATAGSFAALAPARVLDTRLAQGSAKPVPVAAHGEVVVQVVAPSAGVAFDAVSVNITAVSRTVAGYLTAKQYGAPTPVSSVLNFGPKAAIAGAAIVKVGADGRIVIGNSSAQAMDVVVDRAGYFVGSDILPTRS